MKDSYYVPGLLAKVFRGDPLPKVELFSERDLFPNVQFTQPKSDQKDFTIKVNNRGGGIGQIQILVNSKEFVRDVRPSGFDESSKEATFTISLKDAPFVSGKENKIEVITRNSAGSLTNRGTRGADLLYVNGAKKLAETPHIYAIIGGISDYTADNLKLNFAAKDAEEFAKTLEMGATALVGDKTKVHIRLLTSVGEKSAIKLTSPDAKISNATKADFERAAKEVFASMDSNKDGMLGREESKPPREHGVIEERVGPPPNAMFIAAELRFGDKLVKDQPFSAETVIEDTRRLFDGTTVTKTTKGAFYRDSAY